MSSSSRHIALLLYGPTSGGASRRCLTLASEFAQRGHRVDLVVVQPDGPLRSSIADTIRLVPLNSRWRHVPMLSTWRRFQAWAATWALAAYLRRERPDVMMAGANSMLLTAVWAHLLAGQTGRLVLRICTHLTATASNTKRRSRPLLRRLARRFYPRADAIITLSRDMAEDTARVIGVPVRQVVVIPNPVVSPHLTRLAGEPLTHPWFSPGGPPVILGVGRLVKQKDFPTLIEAFALVRRERPARLVILGEAQDPQVRAHLVALAERLGVAADVDLPGLVDNPFAYMSRARVFVLSSAWEGLSGVLIEAMACGCPVVSTDCPGGSAETLLDGACGPLVPVGDPGAMATAIRTVLDQPPESARLTARAADFSVDLSVQRYLEVLLPAGVPVK